MSHKKFRFLFVLLFPVLVGEWGSHLYAQEVHQVVGRVYTDSLVGVSIDIINKTQETGTITDYRGRFRVEVHEGDELEFSLVGYHNNSVKITAELLAKDSLFVHLTEKVNLLQEAHVESGALTGDLSKDIDQTYFFDHSEIGMPYYDKKELTYTERRYIAMASGGPIGFINWLNGTRKILERQMAAQHEALLVERIKNKYPVSFYVEDLHIPEIYIERFLFFCVADEDFERIMEKADPLDEISYLKRKADLYREQMEL